MAVVPKAPPSSVFDLKSAELTLVALVLKTTDLAVLARELEVRFADDPDLMRGEPVAIDLALLREATDAIDFETLTALLRHYQMVPIAARGGNAAQMEAARAAGLNEAQYAAPGSSRKRAADDAAAAELPSSPSAAAQAVATAVTLVIDKPLRSGQQAYARGGDLVVLAAVNVGAEVIADGHIHVYAPLRGRAIAGARGNAAARIFTTRMEPQLVSIAGIYRTIETALPDDVLGKAAQVRLDGETLVIEALKF